MQKERFFFGVIGNKKRTVKLAYIAIMVALNVVVNAVTSIPLGFVQFSFTIAATSFAGIFLGAPLGFVVGFVGDLLGFFLGGGAGYTPFVGMAMGLIAFLFGWIFGFEWKGKNVWVWKVALAAGLSFLLATVGITTTAAFFLWNKTALAYFDFAVLRLFVSGQVWNNIINTALLYFLLPALSKIKKLKLTID